MKNEILDEIKNRRLSKKEIKSNQKVVSIMVIGLLILFTILFGVLLNYLN